MSQTPARADVVPDSAPSTAAATPASAAVAPAEASPASAQRTAPVLDDATRRRNTTVIWLLIVSAFTVILNETIMGVAIPHLMTDLGITAVAAQWLTTAFLLTMAVVIPTTGFMLQRFPTRSLYIVAMSLFVAGTLLAALAPGFAVLLVARVIQATGTAVMLPLLITTVMELEPPATRGRRMGLISVVISVAPAIGPTISGLILTTFSWRFMFVAVLPVAGTVLAIGLARMRTVNEPRKAPIDLLSIPLTAVGFGGLVYGLSRVGESAEGGSATAWIALGVGVVGVALFIWRQIALQRRDTALLDLRTFRTPAFVFSVLLFVVSMMGLFGTIILLPLYMQGVLDYSVLTSGLLLLPGGLVMGLLAPGVGRAFDRLGPRPLLIPGMAVVAGSLWALSIVVSSSTEWWVLLACHVSLSLGLAFVFTPLFTSSLSSLPPRLYSHGSAIVSTIQQVAAAAGTALFVSTMAAVAARHADAGAVAAVAQSEGIKVALLVGACLTTLGVPLAAMLRKPEQMPEGVHAGH